MPHLSQLRHADITTPIPRHSITTRTYHTAGCILLFPSERASDHQDDGGSFDFTFRLPFSIPISLYPSPKEYLTSFVAKQEFANKYEQEKPNDVRISFPPFFHPASQKSAARTRSAGEPLEASKRDLNRRNRAYHTLVLQALLE
jgi:hypothetical protein